MMYPESGRPTKTEDDFEDGGHFIPQKFSHRERRKRIMHPTSRQLHLSPQLELNMFGDKFCGDLTFLLEQIF
jgi:hypothetical protein